MRRRVLKQVLKAIPFLFVTAGWGALNKTYPSSPITTLRMETYLDGISTIYNSTWTINKSSDAFMYSNSTWTFFDPNFKIPVSQRYMVGSTWTVKGTTWTLGDFLKFTVDETRSQIINEILDQDVEEYLVWPSTTIYPTYGTWQGWCLKLVNGKYIPGSCP